MLMQEEVAALYLNGTFPKFPPPFDNITTAYWAAQRSKGDAVFTCATHWAARTLTTQPMHAGLLHHEIFLLGSDNRPRPRDPQPSYAFTACKPVVLHHIQRNQRACATQPGRAVHRNHSLALLRS